MLDRRGRDRVIIAFGPQQPDGQQLVLFGARLNHRAVDRIAGRIVEGGEVAEAAFEPGFGHAFDHERIADRRRLLIIGLRVLGGVGRLDVET